MGAPGAFSPMRPWITRRPKPVWTAGRRGLVLKKVHLNVLARFEPCEGRSHFVDLDLRRRWTRPTRTTSSLRRRGLGEGAVPAGMLFPPPGRGLRSRPHPERSGDGMGAVLETIRAEKPGLAPGVVLLAAVLWLVLLAAALPSSGSAWPRAWPPTGRCCMG